MIYGILEDLKNDKITIDDANKQINNILTSKNHSSDISKLTYANVDYNRFERCGVYEVVFGLGKTPEQIVGVMNDMLEHGMNRILVTRVDAKKAEYVKNKIAGVYYNSVSQLLILEKFLDGNNAYSRGHIAVVTAGTSDLAVAEEAACVCEFFNHKVERVYDVGVAGIHRLLTRVEEIKNNDVIIVVAGMEGALASVVGGLVKKPVIAVPTSIGYGASFNGLAALLSMLSSCSSGVGVTNIDNGFGAAMLANNIIRLCEDKKNGVH